MAGEPNLLNVRGIIPANPEQNIPIKPGTGAYPFPVEPGAWAAVHLGVTRTQITKYVNATAANVIVHTVSAGKTLYLTGASMLKFGVAAGEARIILTTSADVLIANILCCGSGVNAYGNNSTTFSMPIVVTSQQKVRLIDIGGVAEACIQGWEQ